MTADPVPQATVAVVIRTKDRPLFLARALDSVLAQTYEDWVGVIVNDVGDRDPVDAAVAAVAERARGRFHVVHNAVSQGREAAINVGLEAAMSTYVVVLDDDDTWAPTFLERTVGFLEDESAAGVATRTAVVYERIEGDLIVEEDREILASDKNSISLLDTIGRNYLPTNSFVYRRKVQEAIGEYEPSMPVLADWDFNLRFLLQNDVDFIDGEPLAFWHRRPTATGSVGNSVHAAEHEHRLWDTRLRDRYLRTDLARHGGLGYLLYLSEVLDRDRKIATDRGAHLADIVQDMDRRSRERDEEIIRQLAELNANMVSQNNRLVAQMERLGHRIEELYHAVKARSARARLARARDAAAGGLQRATGKSDKPG